MCVINLLGDKSREARREISALPRKVGASSELIKNFYNRCTELLFGFVRISLIGVKDNVTRVTWELQSQSG